MVRGYQKRIPPVPGAACSGLIPNVKCAWGAGQLLLRDQFFPNQAFTRKSGGDFFPSHLRRLDCWSPLPPFAASGRREGDLFLCYGIVVRIWVCLLRCVVGW